jgi:hypothetical protein
MELNSCSTPTSKRHHVLTVVRNSLRSPEIEHERQWVDVESSSNDNCYLKAQFRYEISHDSISLSKLANNNCNLLFCPKYVLCAKREGYESSSNEADTPVVMLVGERRHSDIGEHKIFREKIEHFEQLQTEKYTQGDRHINTIWGLIHDRSVCKQGSTSNTNLFGATLRLGRHVVVRVVSLAYATEQHSNDTCTHTNRSLFLCSDHSLTLTLLEHQIVRMTRTFTL